MKKFFKFPLFMAVAAVIGFSSTSCSDSDNGGGSSDDEKEKALQPVVNQYVNNTVIGTYKLLSDETIGLYEALVALKKEKTTANQQAAMDQWIKARDYWELSEAFLFGPASDFGIDPHIDTWPLAKDELIAELKNDAHIASMNKEDGDEWAGSFLGASLLGFHGIEYILFENGGARDISKITDRELIYAVAVGGDLRNQCFRLEASWAGIDNITKSKREKLEALEVSTTVNNGKYSYGEDMLNAGKAGSTKISVVDACETIIEGCITIADEVGAMKIGKPNSGDDVNYIESPYSYNSKVDFKGNIISVRNAYRGVYPTATVTTKASASLSEYSLSSYFKQNNPDLDTKLEKAIEKAITKIDAIPYPFAKNYKTQEASDAKDACNELADVLGELKTALNK